MALAIALISLEAERALHCLITPGEWIVTVRRLEAAPPARRRRGRRSQRTLPQWLTPVDQLPGCGADGHRP